MTAIGGNGHSCNVYKGEIDLDLDGTIDETIVVTWADLDNG